ncbi:MAG: heavy metal translocating P-type ATPase, partial [Solobacterium sp.]|nr:heavy metal translocating P-type ATPase [Solobacterium sp.]
MNQSRMTMEQADQLEYYLSRIEGVADASVNDRTCNAVILFHCDRETIIAALSAFDYAEADPAPEDTGRATMHEYEDRLVLHVLRRAVSRFLLPFNIRRVITAIHSLKFIIPGIKSLLSGKIEVSVLDATSITVSLIRGDFDTSGSVMFLLGLSEILEEWTRRKSVDDLARSMSLNVDKVWLVTADGAEVLVPVGEVMSGDHIRIRTGSIVPLDGIVLSGDAAVNQSSLTGESLPVQKSEGAYVYAGTVLEEGELLIEVKNVSGTGRYDRIVQMIEESQRLESESQAKAAMLADKLVAYSLGGTLLTYLLTRNA